MASSHNDISNELKNILGSFVKSRTSSTSCRPNNVYSRNRKFMKQPKRGTFEIKIFDIPGSAFYKMGEIDERQLQEIGTGSIILDERHGESAVMTEIYNLIKSFNKEGTSIHESMIKFFKRDDRQKKKAKTSSSFSILFL